MSSFAYYLAKNPHIQQRAREEVIEALGNDEEPDVANLRKMNYVQACIRESLRINTPIVRDIRRRIIVN